MFVSLLMDKSVAENEMPMQKEFEMEQLESTRPQASEPRPEVRESSKTNKTPNLFSPPTPRSRVAQGNSREGQETANHDPAPRGKKRPRSPRSSNRVYRSDEGPHSYRFDDSVSVACPKLDHVEEPTPKSRQRQDVIPGPHGRRRPRRNDGGTYVYTSDSDSADELQPDVDDLAPPKRRRVNDPPYKPSREGQNFENELPAGSSVLNGARRGTQSTTPNKRVSFGAPDLPAEFTETGDVTETSAKKSAPKKPTPKKQTSKKQTPKKATPKNSAPRKQAPKKQTPKKATPERVTPKKVTVEDANSDEEDAYLVPEEAVSKDTACKTTETPKATPGKEATKRATPRSTLTRNNVVEVTPGSRRVTRSATRAAAAEAGGKL
jgi:hypothetical protein